MDCKNPDKCKRILEERLIRMNPLLEEAIIQLERFREDYDEGLAQLAFVDHADTRSIFRAFSKSQVMEAFLEGEVIEARKKEGVFSFLIWYNVKIGRGQYRPIHVSAIMQKTNQLQMMIVTVYDPRSKSWKWNQTYDKRICICEE